MDRRDLLTLGGATTLGLSVRPVAAERVTASRARLSLNENPFGPSPLAVKAIQSQAGQVARYTDETAAASLARQIATREKVPVEQIVLGELLEPLGVQLALNGGTHGEFIYSTPGYTALVDAATQVGGVAVAVPLDAQFQNDLPRIAAAVSDRARAVFLVNPHNPTGTVSDPRALDAFLTQVSQRTLVIVDEAYLDFMDDFESRTAVHHTRNGEDVMVFRTFGKLYGLAGLQIGYAVAPLKRAQQLRQKGLGHFRSLSSLGVAAASASLRDAGYVSRVRSEVWAERRAWHALLAPLNVRQTDSQGNFVFIETRQPHARVAEMLSRQGIEIGRAFEPYEHWARISIGRREENALAREAVGKLLANASRSTS